MLNLNISRIILILSLFLINELHAKSRPSTFNNYRLTLTAGLGYNPILLFNNKFNKYKPYKPNLGLELILSPKYCLNLGFQNEQYKFNINSSMTFSTSDNQYNYANFDGGVTSNMNTYIFDLRKYSFLSGSIAPYGRYISYGLAISNVVLKIEEIKFRTDDNQNGKLEYVFPAYQRKYMSSAFRFGIGRKQFLGKKLKSFLEYQLICSVKFSDHINLDSSGFNVQAYYTQRRLSELSSAFQINILYGFAF
jgi:hypothetical protein